MHQTPSHDHSPNAVANQIFILSKDQVAALKRVCASGVSTFCAVSAHLWRCVCAARRLPPDATTRLIFPANVRASLSPKLRGSFFGNGIIMLGATGKVRDIASKGQLASVAGWIRGAISQMDDELVRSAIDYFEIAGGQTSNQAGSMPETELRVVSWRGMHDADFGRGKPLMVHRAVQPYVGIAYLMDGVGGSMRILMSVEAAIVNDLKRLLYANF
jgi:shikimate O-hydroxycinnamoyltransferase